MAQAPQNGSQVRAAEVIDPQAEQIGQVYAQAFLASAEQDGPVEDRLGELHVFHTVLERRVRHLLDPADGVDELLLDAPAATLLLGDVDLRQLAISSPSA